MLTLEDHAEILDLIAALRRSGRPVHLDTYCCQGGASAGFEAAGFTVMGVDMSPQPRYPYAFVQGDALEFIKRYSHLFDSVSGSPPCQRYTNAQRIRGNDHPDLVDPTRDAMNASGLPWVIENVVGSPLRDPQMLCGAMFGLETYRHRLFETGNGFSFTAPAHPEHKAKLTKMGRAPVPGEFMHIVGNFAGVARAREIMGMPWASRDGLREAIPPAYTEFIGRALVTHLRRSEVPQR